MSYCRWSSMNFGCDVYAYESHDGYVIHLASKRVVSELPPAPDIFAMDAEAWIEAYIAHGRLLNGAIREPIDHPDAGETFVLPTLADFADKLRELREAGYRFPDDVFEMIAEEAAE